MISKMQNQKKHFRHILFFYYQKDKNAIQARKKLYKVSGENVLTVCQCQTSFQNFVRQF